MMHQDPHFLGWLRRNEMLPPTPEELDRLYLEHDAFVARGIEWDNEQKLIIEEFKQKKKELDDKYDRSLLTEGTEWTPGKSATERMNEELDEYASKDETTMVVLSEIDQEEQFYLAEYDKLYKKDKEGNKDVNKLALQELKRAHYYFSY